ncbi:hypothetical protein ABZU32_14865 [Sphaerisporangium sp. NPDC005288]|uniref:hypothetical protein n=1 Tax=Sphaerisporangium sp. NPDC005288 TaxID=3155114 RepID=UPI0033A25BCC
MSRPRGRGPEPEPEEEPFDAFAPNPRNSPPPGESAVTSTGSWEAFPTTFPIPVVSPDDPTPSPLPRRTPGKAPHPGKKPRPGEAPHPGGSTPNPAGAAPGAGPGTADATPAAAPGTPGVGLSTANAGLSTPGVGLSTAGATPGAGPNAAFATPGAGPSTAGATPASRPSTAGAVPASALGYSGTTTGPVDTAPVIPAAGAPEAAPETAAVPRGSTRSARRERGRLVRAARGAGLLVAAAALAAATVGAQWWDKSAWVAERYRPETAKEVGHGQEATLHGVSWQVSVTSGPPASGQDAGTASLVADVLVTPTSAAEIQKSFPPDFSMRDRAGHRWLAQAEQTLIRDDLKVGRPVRMKVVAVVPERLRDTAEFVLNYDTEALRFAR